MYSVREQNEENRQTNHVYRKNNNKNMLLIYMLENMGRVVTREAIMDKIWDLSGNYVNDNTLTVYIKRIREKLGTDDIIKTIKGVGYRVDKE